jgi:hypothetical protein
MDFQSAMGWTRTSLQPLDTLNISDRLADLLKSAHYTAQQQALWYAHEMRIPAPLLVCTIKPSGTISKLPMISSGVHKSRAPYFIRRVRITASDPLAKVMMDAGYPVYPSVVSNGPSERELKAMKPFELAQELQKSSTWVIEFPVKTNAADKASDESAVEQLGRYLDFQKYWTDHNTSITIQFSPDEVNDLIDMLLKHWDEYVAVSFMPKDTTAYPQLPEEPITQSEYEDKASRLAFIQHRDIVEALKDLERTNLATELLDADCDAGYCPVR